MDTETWHRLWNPKHRSPRCAILGPMLSSMSWITFYKHMLGHKLLSLFVSSTSRSTNRFLISFEFLSSFLWFYVFGFLKRDSFLCANLYGILLLMTDGCLQELILRAHRHRSREPRTSPIVVELRNEKKNQPMRRRQRTKIPCVGQRLSNHRNSLHQTRSVILLLSFCYEIY